MVGLVIVSHSNELAKSAVELVKQVTASDFPIAYAGGVGDNKELLGTNAADIMQSIQSVYSDDGVLILMDLGSAIISTKLAIELLGEDYPKIKLCPAPLIEGAVVAAAQIATNGKLEDICFEASQALKPKQKDLGEDLDEVETINPQVKDAVTRRFTVNIENGLHARPAAKLATLLSKFDSEITISNITKDSLPVNAKSVNKIALSSISNGDKVQFAVQAKDAEKVFNSIKEAFNDGFLDISPKTKPEEHILVEKATIEAVSEGIAIGYLYIADFKTDDISKRTITDVDSEINKLDKAIINVKTDLLKNKNNLIQQGLTSEAAIFDAHILMLEDTDVINEIKNEIKEKHLNSEYVYQNKMYEIAGKFRSLSEEYMRERASDIIDIANQVISELMGTGQADVINYENIILAGNEVTPSMVSKWNLEQLKGILTNIGGSSSHMSILAKTMGIPVISGYHLPKEAKTGMKAVFDTFTKEIVIDPSEKIYTEFIARYDSWRKKIEQDFKDSQGVAQTQDNTIIAVQANVGDFNTAKRASTNGAEGVGLLRTEFLFMNMPAEPTEEELIKSLTNIFSYFQDKPITVRTLDIGGDKHISWLPLEKEENPFLGVRGVRLYKEHEDLFKKQLSAIMQAGNTRDVQIMIPMVSTLDEISYVKGLLDNIHKQLIEENKQHLWPIKLGIMVETPSSIMLAKEMAKKVDFFSIGTNDLTQYIMAAERGGKLNELLDFMQPAVLRAIKAITDVAIENNVPISVCGEMAGDVAGAKILMGMGITKLSMNSTSIGKVKRTIRQTSIKELSDKALEALKSANVDEIKKIIDS